MKDVIMFGAGIIGLEFLPVIQGKYNLKLIVDNDIAKQETTISGVPVASPEKISEHYYDFIFITSTAVGEIHDELIKLGVPDKKIKILTYESDESKAIFPWDAFIFITLSVITIITMIWWILAY